MLAPSERQSRLFPNVCKGCNSWPASLQACSQGCPDLQTVSYSVQDSQTISSSVHSKQTYEPLSASCGVLSTAIWQIGDLDRPMTRHGVPLGVLKVSARSSGSHADQNDGPSIIVTSIMIQNDPG